MKQKLFRTDGIRGKAYEYLDGKLAYNFGKAVAEVAGRNNIDKPKVIIGRDTRESGHMLENAVVDGLTNYGVDVIKIGTMPTGAVSFLTKKMGANNGVMITASHNPPEDNGLKLFNGNGFKITDLQAKQMQELILTPSKFKSEVKGNILSSENAMELYEDYILNLGKNLKGLKVGLDCSNGAAEKIAPSVFEKLGAEVLAIGNSSDGNNINQNCGSNNPDVLKGFIFKNGLDIGFAFDGDADRVVCITNKGKILDGDDIIYLFSKYLLKETDSKVIVGTSMSNLGLEENLESRGFSFKRVDVGDKNVVNEMLKTKAKLGGEACGHIIVADRHFNSDAICNAVRLCNIFKENTSLRCDYIKYKSKQFNIGASEKYKTEYANIPEIKQMVLDVQMRLKNKGRLIVRPSGTTPVIRVKIEAKQIESYMEDIKNLIKLIEKHKNA